MGMSATRLGEKILADWNAWKPDDATINRLGDQIYDGVMSIVVDQQSNPDGSLGRERARQTAKAILTEFLNAAGETSRKRCIALARAIIQEIIQNAEILPLTVTNTPADGPAHTHAPAVTAQASRKIV